MKYIIIILFIFSVSHAEKKYYELRGVVTENTTTPRFGINVGDSVSYMLEADRDIPIVYCAPDCFMVTVSEGTRRGDPNDIDRSVTLSSKKMVHNYIQGKVGENYLWSFNLKGQWYMFGETLPVIERTDHGYYYTAEVTLYDWYNSLTTSIKPKVHTSILTNYLIKHDLLGRIK